jgi:hypothetical protein
MEVKVGCTIWAKWLDGVVFGEVVRISESRNDGSREFDIALGALGALAAVASVAPKEPEPNEPNSKIGRWSKSEHMLFSSNPEAIEDDTPQKRRKLE